jgi:hypothetical protein
MILLGKSVVIGRCAASAAAVAASPGLCLTPAADARGCWEIFHWYETVKPVVRMP